MHAIRTANPDNTLIVHTSYPKIFDCITAAERTIRECRLPQLPDTDVVISMIKERPGRVIGHATSHKEDLSFGHRATVLAIASRKRAARTIADDPRFQSIIHASRLRNDQSLGSNIASSSSSSHTDINVPEITIHPIPPSMTMSSSSSADTLQQPTTHNVMDQAVLSHQSATGNNDSSSVVMPEGKKGKKRKLRRDKKERRDTTKAPKLAKPKSTSKRNQRLQQMEDMFEPAIDHGLDLSDEEESQQQPTTTTTLDNVSQQPIPQERSQGWISWIRSIFF
ncbi:hypothetical protein LRAMOSA06162 [Lichtheimia ramosa]|uniref:Uncharacterized protein n=1 Tax=Lichtheimia ramosa TaxID=688394 RepID=A0A077X2H2_9FUNG|nr:hypothetical protein LRAMOSA06162 [Lichtheimia ramosa]